MRILIIKKYAHLQDRNIAKMSIVFIQILKELIPELQLFSATRFL